MRELDQENRISGLKYKNVKRQLRHNHLKPISRAGSAAGKQARGSSVGSKREEKPQQVGKATFSKAAPGVSPTGKDAKKALPGKKDAPKKIDTKSASKPQKGAAVDAKSKGKSGTYKTETTLKGR